MKTLLDRLFSGASWAFHIGLLLIVASQSAALAEEKVYYFVDENGVTHLSNTPSDPRYKPLGPVQRRHRLLRFAPIHCPLKSLLCRRFRCRHPGSTSKVLSVRSRNRRSCRSLFLTENARLVLFRVAPVRPAALSR
jgi:hypothetical protein